MSSFVVRVDLRDTPVWATNTPSAQACVCKAFTKVLVPIVDPRFVQRNKDLDCAVGYVDPKYAGCFDPEDPSRLKYFKSRLYMSHDPSFFSADVASKFEKELWECGFFPKAVGGVGNSTHPGLNGPIRRDGEDDISWKVSGALFVSILVMLVLKHLCGEIRATWVRRAKATTPPPPPPPPTTAPTTPTREEETDEEARMLEEMDDKV